MTDNAIAARILSVDFQDTDVGSDEMVLRIAMPSGGIVGGPVWVSWALPREACECGSIDVMCVDCGEPR